MGDQHVLKNLDPLDNIVVHYDVRSQAEEKHRMKDNKKQAQLRTPGPLIISTVNSRYFTVASVDGANQKIVYLTGSHVNNNFHDGIGSGKECAKTPEQFDFSAYLKFLKDHGHNFIRLWRWEQFKGYLHGADVHFCMTPQPWPRIGPGTAKDGKPKFDLSMFDQAYFNRLRDRVIAAGNEGIYVSLMLFEGFSLHLTATPDNVEGHPFHAANNVNDISITSIIDYQVLPLDQRIQAIQEAYICKVIDTLCDLPNVLYEVANESSGENAESIQMPDGSPIATPIGDSTQWQYWVIDFVKQYEQQMGYDKHPVGMTFQYPVTDQSKANDPLWDSPADWISPGFDDGPTPSNSRWLMNPPVNDGAKVVISDTDHYSPFSSDALWAWKSFLRGHNPILYDLGIVGGVNPPEPSSGTPSYNSLEPARYAMGDTLRYAERISLARMEPHSDHSSTGYVLANPGQEYLVLEPSEKGTSFTVTLAAGTYAVEWHNVNTRETAQADTLVAENAASPSFSTPFEASGPTLLYLKKLEH
jgi:hypothetical protein